jgi:Mce-associated membrane protein
MKMALKGSRRLNGMLTAAVIVVAVVAGGLWYTGMQAERGDRAGQDCLTAANAAAQAIFSYDYRTFDASVTNGKAFTTGDFTREYAQTTATLKAAAQKEQAVVRAQVSAASVVTATPDRVELLVYLDQYRRNANITGEKVDQNRVALTMVRVGRDWKVSKAQAL